MDDNRMPYCRSGVNLFLRLDWNFCLKTRGAKILGMKKDTRLTFRVHSSLKSEIEAIADREGQSVARICEAFLLAGADVYKKQGGKFLERLVGRLSMKPFN